MDEILYIKDENNACKVVYKTEARIIQLTSLQYMKKLCFMYGCNFNYQVRFVSSILKIRQKVPVILNVENKHIYFPVYGLKNENIWIHYKMIQSLKQDIRGRCIVCFKGGKKLTLLCDRRSIQRQRRRCRRLLEIIKESIIE